MSEREGIMDKRQNCFQYIRKFINWGRVGARALNSKAGTQGTKSEGREGKEVVVDTTQIRLSPALQACSADVKFLEC